MLRNKERELQDLEEKHQVEIKIYKQRVKHLLYEHQNEITQRKTDSEMALKLAQDDHRGDEGELKSDRRALKLELKEMELAHDDFLKCVRRALRAPPAARGPPSTANMSALDFGNSTSTPQGARFPLNCATKSPTP